jgi:propionyl-CoA synthetase
MQDQVYRESIQDPEGFWRKQAETVHWHKKPQRALQKTTKALKNGVKHDHWSWYPDGEISTTYNCVDRHVVNGKFVLFLPVN